MQMCIECVGMKKEKKYTQTIDCTSKNNLL